MIRFECQVCFCMVGYNVLSKTSLFLLYAGKLAVLHFLQIYRERRYTVAHSAHTQLSVFFKSEFLLVI